MIEKVITGGQTGADQAGWRAAKAIGLATGGWMPRGYQTEAGARPEFARLYGAREHESPSYPDRRLANLRESDAAICFNHGPRFSPGTRGLLIDSRLRASPPVKIVGIPSGGDWKRPTISPEAMADFLASAGIRVLMVAGNRESQAPGIGAWVEAYLIDVFNRLREEVGIERPSD